MEDLRSRLLEAHVNHELQRFQDNTLPATIQTWVNFILDSLKDVAVHEWLSPEKINETIKKYAVDFPISGGVTEVVGECSRKFLDFPIHASTELKDIFNREQWDYIVEKLANMETFRNRKIHQMLNSQVGIQTVTDILFQSIKEYLFNENILVKTFPGIARLLQQGRQAVESMPEFENSLSRNIHLFIENNLGKILKNSEKYIQVHLTRERLMDYGDEVWNTYFNKSLSKHFGEITSEDMEDFLIFGFDFWLYFRKTTFFIEVYQEIVQLIWEKYKDFSVLDMLEDLGITRTVILEEVQNSGIPILRKLRTTGKMEQLVRLHLESFYQSNAFRSAMRSE
ncbi:MAG: hypothetical protein HQM11_20550 [SAR324 cluster bacterium]|nr:hypothetical protein [SAR324 cluster bacterium]